MQFLREACGIWLAFARSPDTIDQVTAWVVLALLVVTALILLWLVYRMIYVTCDRIGRPLEQANGKIVAKIHELESWSVTPIYNPTLKMMTVTRSYTPESWHLEAEIDDGRSDTLPLTHAHYDKVREGQRVKAIYRVGRFSRKIFLESVEIDLTS